MPEESRSRGTIIVVEDDPNISDLLYSLFESDNYNVVPVGDGIKALEETHQTKADLITLDLSLPGMNGQDVLHHLKNDERTRQIPVIIISAHAASVNGEVREMAEMVIPKPFDVGELLERVESVMRHSPAT